MSPIFQFFLICMLPLVYQAGANSQPAFNKNITLCETGRNIYYLPDKNGRTAWAALAGKIDCAESSGNGEKPLALEKSSRPVAFSRYQLDLTRCVQKGCYFDASDDDLAGEKEGFFLHYATPTRYQFQEDPPANMEGCDKTTIRRECRIKVRIGGQWRWIYNQKDTDFQAWMTAQLIKSVTMTDSGTSTSLDTVFLDEHSPGFVEPLSFNGAKVSGGVVLEYGKPYNEIDQSFNDDVTKSLTIYHKALADIKKKLFVNVANYVGNSKFTQMILDQSASAGGIMGEYLNAPTRIDGLNDYNRILEVIKNTVKNGGDYHLYGLFNKESTKENCESLIEIPTDALGNYATAKERWNMWRLANYYIVKEGPTDTGRVFLYSNLCIELNHAGPSTQPDETRWLGFLSDWMAAYDLDLGPAGKTSTIALSPGTVQAPDCPLHPSVPRSVLVREFPDAYGGKAVVYLRPRDGVECSNFGDTSAFQLPLLDQNMHLVTKDGPSASSSKQFTIRSAEALILVDDGVFAKFPSSQMHVK